MSDKMQKWYENESALITQRGMLADSEKQLAWLRGPENTQANNPDYDLTENDIEYLESEIRELKRDIAKLEEYFEKHPTPPAGETEL